MTRRSFRYIAIALGVVALLGMSLVHFDSFAAAQSNKKTRAVSPGKSTKADMPSAAARATDRGTKDRLCSFRRARRTRA